MKKNHICVLLFLAPLCLMVAQIKPKIDYFDLQQVKLLDSPFKQAQELDKKYLLELNADRLLAPFLKEAGLKPKAENYPNWENTGLDGHIAGHYLSALSLMYASTGDEEIQKRLNYLIEELQKCQIANQDGYIGGVPGGKKMWNEIANGNIKASPFDLNGKWVPLYNIHKTYAGLRDAYLYTHNETAKKMLIGMSEWTIHLVSKLSDKQIQEMLRSEHGGLNEIFADVASITGDERYLKLAHQFSHQLILNPLLANQDQLTGMHANTQIPKVIGFKRVADVEGNEKWDQAARFFWDTVVQNRSVANGGNSVSEHFNPITDFSKMIQSVEGPETCNTYNMLRLSNRLYQTSVNKKYVEYYEKALYNHILASQHPEQGGLVYFTPMRSGHYRVYSQTQTGFWCCVGSGIENHAKYAEMIYAHTDKELFVNLFIPSTLDWKEKKVEVIQETRFPDEPKTTLTVNPQKTTTFTLKLRCPAWANKERIKLWVNGTSFPIINQSADYISISRKWKRGDKLVFELPMDISVEQLPDQSNNYAFFYGPILLAAKAGNEDLKGLFADESRGGHVAHGKQIPINEIPIIVSDPAKITSFVTPVAGQSLTFTLKNLYSQKYPKEMELIPFFRLHDSRYIIYWPQAAPEQVDKIKKEQAVNELFNIKIDQRTIDKVVCGQQQPESDHLIEFQNSEIGFSNLTHWRQAKEWFSYQFKNEGQQAKFLYLTYLDQDKDQKFDIYINQTKIETLILEGNKGHAIQSKLIAIPVQEAKKEPLILKLVAHPNGVTAKICEVSILNQGIE